jgi:hypothetical protein
MFATYINDYKIDKMYGVVIDENGVVKSGHFMLLLCKVFVKHEERKMLLFATIAFLFIYIFFH